MHIDLLMKLLIDLKLAPHLLMIGILGEELDLHLSPHTIVVREQLLQVIESDVSKQSHLVEETQPLRLNFLQ